MHGQPHLDFDPDPTNTLYVAAERLTFPGRAANAPAGLRRIRVVCARLAADGTELSSAGNLDPAAWRLPGKSQGAHTLHSMAERWSLDGDSVVLQTVSRGQEFVLDAAEYPDALAWAADLLDCPRAARR